MKLVIDIQYFGEINYFKILNNSDLIVYDVLVPFQKMSMINRCRIVGANGPILLTIPLSGGRNQKTMLKEIRIDNSRRWQSAHWRSIYSCYNRSPWFSFYKDELAPLFSRPYDFLVDCLLDTQRWVRKQLGWHQEVVLASTAPSLASPAFEVDKRRQAADNAVPADRIATASYHQVFQERIGFYPNMSILDLLFCEGATFTKQWLEKAG